MNFDDFKLAVEAFSGGKNTVIFDDLEMPSIMVRFPRIKNHELLEGASETFHPAFIVNGSLIDEFLWGKYISTIYNNRAYSLPFRDPQCYKNHDEFKQYCQNKGLGWHMGSNAEWAAIALWCEKNGTVPHGNIYCGCDMDYRHEKGKQTYDYVTNTSWNGMECKQDEAGYHNTGRTATGSGPATWNHDHTPMGITDMVGNCWERPTGLRLMDGEINIIPNNDSAAGVDESRNSALWKAIMPDGTLVAPGTAGTLHYDASSPGDSQQTDHSVGGAIRLNNKRQYPQYTGGSTESYYGAGGITFNQLAAASGVTIPELAKLLGLYPINNNVKGNLWVRNYGERLPLRGGGWYDAAFAGLWAMPLFDPRTLASNNFASRCAYVNL